MKYIPLINKSSTEKTANLYHFLQDIQGKFVLSGQHNFAGKRSDYSDQLEELIGKKALVWGSDFSFCIKGDDALEFEHAGPVNLPDYPWERLKTTYGSPAPGTLIPPARPQSELEFLDISLEEARKATISEAISRHREGHIITMMWHGGFPTDGDICEGSSLWAWEHRPSPEKWDDLMTEGTSLNDAWKAGADVIAGYLNQLQEAGVPVLWRPYHEMNGVWFWWCNHKGEMGFKRLWTMMYDYFTNHHQLNNLIWVWNANAPRDIPGDEAWPYKDFFPGLDYVDVLAADVYLNDYNQSHHDQLVDLGEGKPISLGECGHIPGPEVLDQQPQWTWFMPWGWILFYSNEPEFIKQVYLSERVLTLDEITVDEKGNHTLKKD